MVVKIKKQKTKKCVIKIKLKFENYKSCLEEIQLDNKIKYLEINKINIVLKKPCKIHKKQQVNIKNTAKM